MRALAVAVSLVLAAAAHAGELWLRGNTHAHTNRSDGDSPPEDVVRWYRDHGYDFLVITDHDTITRADGGGLLLIAGEEVTDRLPKKPLHVNAIGLTAVVKPQGGRTPVEVLQRNLDAVRAAGGIAQINHPNFGWAFGTAELLELEGAALLEIASGHPLVNMAGGGGVPAVEQMWDALLSAGRKIWGVAVDDAHHFQCEPPAGHLAARPGLGWIVVRAPEKSEKAVLKAIEAGDFYASTGVELSEIAVRDGALRIAVREKDGAKYRTRFIGRAGRVLQESASNPAVYAIGGSEGYVRAKVIDSNGRAAWTQPLFTGARSRSR